MMIKAILPIFLLVASASTTPTLNLNKLTNIQRFIDDLETSPTVYRSHLPSSYSTAINGYFQLPVFPTIPALRYNGVSSVYVPPQGYYSPHTGQLTGQVVGSYPLVYNGYAQPYGWKH